MKSKNCIRKNIIISVGLILIISVGIWHFATGGLPYMTEDINDYGKSRSYEVYSNLNVFPEMIQDTTEVINYNYYYRNTYLDPTCQIYLECIYSQEEYDDEIMRLSKVGEIYKGQNKEVKYDEENFEIPAYVAIYNDNECYEYALVEEEKNRIIYIFTQFMKKDKVLFPREYLSKNFSNESIGGYSIYVFDDETVY